MKKTILNYNKMKNIFSNYVLAVTTMTLLVACGGRSTQETSTANMHAEHATADSTVLAAGEPQFQVDKTFQEHLARTFGGYLKMKDAFVNSDAQAVKAEAKNLKATLKAVDTKMLSGAALNDWANYSNNLDMSLAEITGSDDIEAQRASFSALSENFYRSIRAYGLGGPTAYYEFCPMAFNDQGAYWLSDSRQIRNPYFGDKMLTCGRVTEELK